MKEIKLEQKDVSKEEQITMTKKQYQMKLISIAILGIFVGYSLYRLQLWWIYGV